MIISSSDSKRLTESKIIWLSTVSNTNAPHLVPIWFVFHNSKIFICTGENSVKMKHLRNNKNIAFALEDGVNPLTGTGTTTIYSVSNETDSKIVQKFKDKYDWDVTTDKDYTQLIEIEINKILMRKN